MAVETKGSKRKNAEDLPKPKRAKKVTEEPSKPTETTKVTKVAKTSKTATSEAIGTTKVVKEKSERTTRKRAADFFDGPETTEEPVVEPPKKKKAKKSAKDAEVATEKAEPVADVATPQKKQKGKKAAKKDTVEVEAEAVAEAPASKGKKSKSKKGPISEPVDEVADEEAEDDIDDQTAALLKGFESSEDENEDSADEAEEDGGVDVETIDNPASKKALQYKLSNAAKTGAPRGVVYVGRIPHGFYEHQMRAYFSQFGDITRLRLSRNKKTGASKHFAFIEFSSEDVARIVAETMDKYLMFNHILQVRFIPTESVHENLFLGANSRFKAVPGGKIEGRKLKQPLDKKGWDKRIEKENKRRSDKAEKLKAIDYEFEAPELKGPESVLAIRETEEPVEDGEGAQKLITAGENGTITTKVDERANTLEITGTVTVKKPKKGSKRAAPEPEADAPVKVTKKSKGAAVEADAPAVVEAVTAKKSKKAKIEVAVEPSEPAASVSVSVTKPKKEKKAKKDTTADVPEAEPAIETSPAAPISKSKKEKKSKKAATEATEPIVEPEAAVEKPKKEKKSKKTAASEPEAEPEAAIEKPKKEKKSKKAKA